MANQIYNNIVIEDMFKSVLTTALDMNQFMEIDNSLTAEAGNVKRIVKHSVQGSVENLAMTVGNSGNVELTVVYEDYPVETVQGRAVYYDEEAAADGTVVDNLVKGLGEKMVNDFTAKACTEWRKATYQQSYASAIDFNTVVDAIAKLNLENEDGLFMLISPNMVAGFRKALKDDLKYSEAFVRSGYIGSVCGVPCYVSKAIQNGEAIIARKDAVKLFIKKDTEVETERDANTRKNSLYIRKVGLVALVDDSKVCRIAKQATTTATITTYTKNQKTVAGAATTGATVEVYINGVLDGTATASSSAYSYTAKANLAADDEVKVIAKMVGEVDSIAEVTVAA